MYGPLAPRHPRASESALAWGILQLQHDSATDFASSVSAPISPAAARVVGQLAGDARGSVLILLACAVSRIAHRLTGVSPVAMDLPPDAAQANDPAVSAATPVALQVGDGGTVRDVLTQAQRVVRGAYRREQQVRTPQGVDEAEPADAEICIHVDTATTGAVACRHSLRVSYCDGSEPTVQLSSPTAVVPVWLLESIGRWLDELLAAFGELDSPARDLDGAIETTARESHRVVNESARPFPEGATVVDLFRQRARHAPESRAITASDRTLTYRAAQREVDALARYMSQIAGVGRGQVVASLTSRTSWAALAPLAIMQIGAVYMPLNPGYPPSARARILDEAEAVLVLADTPQCPSGIPVAAIDACVAEGILQLADAVDAAPPSVDGAETAYIVYTSGTSGRPKGVRVGHRGLTNTVVDHLERLPIRPTDRYLQFMATSFDGFILDVMSTLCAGAELIIASEQVIANPDALTTLMSNRGVTMTTMTPTYLRRLHPARIADLRVVVAAGEVLDVELADRLATLVELYNGYGPTEATVNSTLFRVRPGWYRGMIPVGPPSANKLIYVVDGHARLQPPGVVGEIWIGGVGIAKGYVGDSKLTEKHFGTNPFSGGGSIYRTGDFGAWDAAGNLCFVGRRDGQLKVNGFRVELGEVNAQVLAIPSVIDSHTFAHQRADGEIEVVVAYHSDSEGLTATAVRWQLAHRLPRYLVPARVVRVEDWPRTHHHKSDLASVEAAGLVEPGDMVVEESTSEVERRLLAIWRDVFGVAASLDGSFLQLGGDSIRAIDVARRARAQGIAIDAATLFEDRTIRELAVELAQSDVEPSPAVSNTSEAPARRRRFDDDVMPASSMQSYMIAAAARDHSAQGIYLGFAEWMFVDDALDESAMLRALQALWEYNPALRMTFVDGSNNLTVALSASAMDVTHVDLRGFARAEVEKYVRMRMADRAAIGFDPFGRDPLFTVELARTSPSSCSLLVHFHHALLDGWSGVELRNQIYAAYRHFKWGGAEFHDDQVRDGHRDFIEKEREICADEEAKAFWRREVARVTEFATAELRPPRRAELDVELPADVIEFADEQRRVHSVTLKAVFLRGFAGALLSLGGAETVAMGIVVNGRSAQMANPLGATGMFWNIAPLVVSSDDLRSAAHVQNRLIEQARFAQFPLKLIEEDIAKRQLCLPIYNFVQFHNTAVGATRLSEGIVQSRFHFPLTCFVRAPAPGQSSGKLRLGYDGSTVDGAQARAILERMLAIMTPKRRQ